MRQIILLILWITLLSPHAFSQTKVIEGKVRDGHSDEVVPFASIAFRLAGTGKLADSAGTFIIRVPSENDTLEITSVGYQDFRIAVKDVGFTGDSGYIVARLVPGKLTADV